MQLSRFKSFLDEVAKDQNLVRFAKDISVFRYWNASWFDESDDKIDEKELINKLQLTLKKGKHWRQRNSTIAFFPLSEIETVAVVQFATKPTTRTRGNFQNAIDACLDRAQKSFDASHDMLTGLLNNATFAKKALQAIDSLEPQQEEEQYLETGPVQGRNVTFVAIDIDHFKQINDTYGHVYGDIVLQALGRRFETLAMQISKERTNDIQEIHVGRPSGEEFLVLLVGNLDLDASLKLGDIFRQEVCKGSLPSDEEWETIQSTTDENESMQPPPLSERTITVSVGVASTGSRRSLPSNDPAQALRDRADRALYCAKSGGRNTVRHFEEILTRYGVVLEHKEDVDVVIIDIGREVNVQKGQEFIVYHPQFSGQVPYFYDDGRTKRVLGICPKVPIGRIVAFEIQPEISFCRVEDKKCPGIFNPSSVLEAVPLGSISHLISREGFLAEDEFQLNTPKEVTSKCKEAQENGIQTMAVVFSIKKEESLMDARGSVFVNHCLAKLYEIIRDVFPDTAYVVKVRDTEFGVVWMDHDSDQMKLLSQETTSKAAEACKNLTEFCSGLYIGEKKFDLTGDSSELSWEWALDYADYALAYAKLEEKDQAFFSPETANGLLYALRKSKQFTIALKDYRELIQRGLNYYLFENQAALCAWEMPDRNSEILLQASERALELNPEDNIVWANSGFFHYYLGNIPEAYQRFRKLKKIDPDYKIENPYLYPFADAIHQAYVSKICDLDADWIRSIVEQAKSKAQKEDQHGWYVTFNRALKHYRVTQ